MFRKLSSFFYVCRILIAEAIREVSLVDIPQILYRIHYRAEIGLGEIAFYTELRAIDIEFYDRLRTVPSICIVLDFRIPIVQVFIKIFLHEQRSHPRIVRDI